MALGQRASQNQNRPKQQMEPVEPPLTDGRYCFSNDWFGGSIQSWDRILTELKPSRVLEVGSYEGRSACYLIERISAVRVLEIHCVDSWQGGIENDPTSMPAVESRFDENISVAASLSVHKSSVTTILGKRATVIVGLFIVN